MLRRLSTVAGRAASVLVAAALALAPVVAFADAATAAPMTDHTAVGDQSAPCDMPCDDCFGDEASFACKVACGGLVAQMLAVADVSHPAVPAVRTAVAAADQIRDRRREPDKPPPKPFLD